MSDTMNALNDELYTHLQQQSFVLLHTTDLELGPTSSAISWIYASERDRLRFAIDTKSKLGDNLSTNPRVCVTVFASGGVYAVHGRVVPVTKVLENVPFEVSCFDIEIESWRNSMYAGSRLLSAPACEKTYDKRAADKLDGQVFDAMRKA